MVASRTELLSFYFLIVSGLKPFMYCKIPRNSINAWIVGLDCRQEWSGDKVGEWLQNNLQSKLVEGQMDETFGMTGAHSS